MNQLTFQQDNHEKLKVTISEEDAIKVIKAHTKWRSGDMLARFRKQGSKEYDTVVKKMHQFVNN